MAHAGDLPLAEAYLCEIAARVEALERTAREALLAATSADDLLEARFTALLEACAEARTLHLSAAAIQMVAEDARAALLAEQETPGPRLRLLGHAAGCHA